jgi:phosphate:Na+ symporter
MEQTQNYIDNLHLGDQHSKDYETTIGTLHVLDHLQRLYKRCTETERAVVAKRYKKLHEINHKIIESNNHIIDELHNNLWYEASIYARNELSNIENSLEGIRDDIMKDVATDNIDAPQANQYLEAVRWIARVGDHIERITFHLATGTERQFIE